MSAILKILSHSKNHVFFNEQFKNFKKDSALSKFSVLSFLNFCNLENSGEVQLSAWFGLKRQFLIILLV